MWSLLLGLVPGLLSTVNGITNAISNEKIALINAKTKEEQIASQERINTLTARRDVLIADSSRSSLDMWIRLGYSIGPIYILNKIYLYDKTFDGTTTLSPELWNVIMVTIGFYFLHSTASLFRK